MEIRDLIPQHKHDHERTEKLKKIDKDIIRTIIPDLMIWLQDGNWPVFPEVRDILLQFDKELIPYIKDILNSNNSDWKYFMLTGLVSKLPKETIAELKRDIVKIAVFPSRSDKISELDDIVKDIVAMMID